MKQFCFVQFAVLNAALGLGAAVSGCEAPVSNEAVGAIASGLTVTNCTGAAISAAIAAGGTVTLSCGSSPVSVSVPLTSVTQSVQLSAVPPGAVTLVHTSVLFAIGSGISFGVTGVNFDGSQSQSATAFAAGDAPGTNIALSDTNFQGYATIALAIGTGTTLTVTDSTFANNTASSFGAPIFSEEGNVSITGSTFFNNSTNGFGGAITAGGGSLSISDSTFFENQAGEAGGALFIDGPNGVTIVNSTFFGNFSNGGAAIYVAGLGTPPTISYSTFADNIGSDGAIVGSPSPVVLASILLDPEPVTFRCTLTGASNIQWPPGTSLCGAGFVLEDPDLGGLANNGGPTETMALLPGSPAIDGSTLTCPPPITDQRGVPRTPPCDIGAFEH